MEAKLLVICAMLAFASATPMRLMSDTIDSCAVTCKPSTKFSYGTGQTFIYDYSVQTETLVDGASEERAVLSIGGQAFIEVIDQCEMVLMLRRIRIHESSSMDIGGDLVVSPSSQRLGQVLESTPLRFSFQDGVVEGLCPASGEDPWSLNVKRGILSALQNSMDFEDQQSQTVQESDVTGQCMTEYEVQDSSYWGGKTTIKRRKDLKACTQRQGFLGSLHTSRFQTDPSGSQSIPLMESEHECEQVLSDGIVQSSVCTEKHLFRPFSAHKGGALTSVIQTLTFKTRRDGISSRKDWIDTRAEITFDHGYSIKDSSEAKASAETLLGKLCDMTLSGVQPDVPRVFSQLVEAVKKLDSSDIRAILQKVQEKSICRINHERTKKFFLDALPMAASNEAVDLMKDLMISGDVSGLQVDLYLASMAFIPKPTAEMIESAKVLMNDDKLRTQAMLAVSSMVHTHCQKVGDCSFSRAVEDIIEKLGETIGSRCSVNDGNIKTVLTTLNAIGNTGQSRAISYLDRCLGDRKPLEVRVAAAQAFRRMPCDANRRPLVNIAEDREEHSELRIMAYLQLMTCPSTDLLDTIQVLLEGEPEDSQVGSFIQTHLTNLKETSSPLKQDIKRMLNDLTISKSFHTNPLKFSRNYEKSAFLQAINSGGQAESNVIFSPQSPLPRSVTANMTVDVLGHSINLLEIGARLEGVEYLIESLQAQIFGEGKNKGAKNKLDELKGSGYARIFGNELLYNRFQGLQSLTSGKTFNLLDFLIKLSKDHDYSFTQSLQFLDCTLTTPTIGGLPLTLSVNGTATVDVKATGKMDLRKVSKSPRTLNVEGELRPSGAVNIDGVMSVDGLLTSTGLKVTSSLHSGVVIKGRVELDRGRTLNVQLDVPDDRMDIVDLRTKFFILHNKAESEQKMITDNRRSYELCSGNVMSAMTGLELCGQLQFPNASMQSDGPYFPMTGPSSFSLVLHKRDSHSGYKLLAKRVENKRSSIAQLSFDTPGSSVARAVSFDMMVDYPQREAEISFASPWKKTSVKGSLVSDPGLKSIMGSVVIDDDQIYSLTSEIKVDEQGDSGITVFTPVLKVRRPGADDLSLMGDLKMDKRFKRLSMDLTLSGVIKKPLQLQGSYTNTQTEKGISTTFKLGKRVYSAEAGVNYNIRGGKNANFRPLVLVTTPRGEAFRLDGQTDWRQGKTFKSEHTLTIPSVLDTPANLKCDIKRKSRRKGPRYDVDVRFKSKPFTGKVSGFVVLADTTFTNLKVDYNAYKLGRDKVTITGKLSNRSTGAFKKYSISSAVEFKRHPDWNVDSTLDLEHKRRRSGGSLNLILGKDRKDVSKKVTLSASMARDIKSLTNADVNYKMKAIIPMLGVDYSMNGAHKHSKESLNSQLTFKYQKGKAVNAKVNLKGSADKQLRLNGDASLSFPGHSYEVDSGLKKKGKQLVHTFNMKTHKGPLVTMTSTYKPSKDQTHGITSNLDINGFKPIKISGMVGLEPKNLQLQGEAVSGADSYSIGALSKISKGPRGKWTLDASSPNRTVGVSLSGGLQKTSADLDFDLDWDKEMGKKGKKVKSKDNDSKISLSLQGTHKASRDVFSSSAKMDLSTPFADKFSAAVSVDGDRKRYGMDGKVTLGPKSNSYFSTVSVSRPLLVESFKARWTAGAPIRGWKRMEASVDHSLEPSSLSTVVKASRGKEQAKLSVIGKNEGFPGTRDLSADVTFTSSIRGLDDVTLSLTHKDDGRKFDCSAIATHNKDRYSAELDMTHSINGWELQNSGNLKITSPSRAINTRWQHSSSDSDVSTTVTSGWGRGQKLQVEVTGDTKLTDRRKIVNGAITIQSPWESIRDLSVTLKHEMSGKHCVHEATVVHNGEKKASTDLNYHIGQKQMKGGFTVTSPYMERKAGSMNVNYQSYPATLQAQLHLKPRYSIEADASFTKSGDKEMEGTVRVTTPFRAVRTITLSGSTSVNGEDFIAKGNLDYGIRQNYDAMITFRPETLTLGRVVIHTPLIKFSSLDAGYQIAGKVKDMRVTADFSLQPIVDKYSASINWLMDEEMSAKVRVNTPIKTLRYMQMTASSKSTDQGRRSRVEVEYYPRKMYALTSFYTAEMPVIFSLNAETPIEGYDSFGVSVKHQHDDTSISTHGEVQFLPNKVIESTLVLNWERNVDGSLVVKTPFLDFEESRVSVRHDGELDNFKSHAEIEIMHETANADAEFKYGYATSGSLSVLSSKYLEKIDAAFNKRGTMENFRSAGSIAYGDQKIEGTLTHKFNSRVLKTAVTFESPFIKTVKSSVDVSNRQGNIQATIIGQYGPKKVDSTSSLQIDDYDFSGTTSITHNLKEEGEEKMQATVSKKGDMKDLQIQGTITSPYTEDISLSVQHSSDLHLRLKTTVSGSYGDEYSISSDNAFSGSAPTLSASSVNKYKVGGPLKEASASFSLTGDIKEMTGSAASKFGDKEISIEGQMKTDTEISGSLQVKTPFEKFEGMGVSVKHVPNDEGFEHKGSLTYMTGKTIQHSITLVHRGSEHLQLDGSLETPIPDLERSSIKLHHDFDKNQKLRTGEIEVQSPAIGKYGMTGKAVGDLEQMTVDGTLDMDGEKAEGHMEWVPLTHGYKHTMELKTLREVLTTSTEFQMTDDRIICKTMASLPPASISFDGEGSVSGFNAEISGNILISSAILKDFPLRLSLKKAGSPKDFDVEMETGFSTFKASATGNFKNTAGEISGKMTIKTPFHNLENIGGSFKHSGDLNHFSSEGALQFEDKKEISGKVTFYRYEWMRLEATAELNTPLIGYEFTKAEYRHAGSGDSFTCTSSVQYGDSRKISSDLRATLSPKYDITLTVKTPFEPFEKVVAEAKLETLATSHSARGSLDLGRGKRYAIEGGLDVEDTSLAISTKLTTPLEQLPSVEVSGTYQGKPSDFTSTLVFNSPQTDVIKYDSMLKFKSLFDINAAASVNSEIAGMEDLRIEVKNADMGNSKNGHVLVRWAPRKQVSLDGTYVMKDYWYNKELQADFTITTPFEKVRTANVHVQHEKKDKSYMPKIEVTVNGDSLLDVEGELNTGDNPSASLLTRSPKPTQITAALTRDGHDLQTELFINWDRDQNDQHVRLQTKAKDIRDDYQTSLDYSVKIIRPSRTVSTGVSLVSKDQKVISEGYVSLSDRSDRKIFYTLDYSDNSNYYVTAYDGTLKFGVPGRTLEAAGSFSQGSQTGSVDASFAWDAERDASKLVGINGKITKGDTTKADLTFRLPSIGKEVHIDHEMALNQGRTVWDGKTAVSYSPDSRRTLTLTSSLKEISDYGSGKNYSLKMSISHPHTNTDIKFTSHIGATEDRLSAAMDTVYMTSRRTRKNMMLRGEIDRLRRQIDFQLDSPVKKVSMHGEVQSTEPYVIQLTNTYDQDEVIQSRLKIDPSEKSMQFSTNYDLDKPNDQVIVKAGYLNASVLSAELLMQQDGIKTSEGGAIVRLDSPSLIHTGLSWNPQAYLELENYIRRKTVTYSDDVRYYVDSILEATGQEVSDKYAAIAEEFLSELSPLVDLLEGEFIQVGQQIDKARKILSRMYRRNDLHMHDMGQYVLEVIELLKEYSAKYQTAYHEALSEMRGQLQAMTDYDIKGKYIDIVNDLILRLKLGLARASETLDIVDEELTKVWQSGQERWEQVKNHPHVQHLQHRVQRLGQDYRWLMGYVGRRVSNVGLPDSYASAIYDARNKMAEGLVSVMENKHVKKVKDVANEAYQQGAWAYRYWNVEENTRKQIRSVVKAIGEFVLKEIDQMSQQLRFLKLTKITVYDPEEGRLEAHVVLPIQLKSLQELPDLSAYVKKAEEIVDNYLPDKDSVVELYQKYAPWVENTTTPDDDIMSQFKAYTPSSPGRRRQFRKQPRLMRI